ncbi:MAG: ABC transporter substrate-binding protein, partial [Chloroflexota bacterium]|nr:ABC transporter substrate-binding protein [Chloroflexota bacterium]
KDAIGTGPFRFKEHVRGVSVELVKNSEYFRPGLPYLDGIMFYVIGDYGAMNAAFRTKRVHLLRAAIHSIRGPELERLRKEIPEMVVQERVTQGRNFVAPNLGRKPWDDVRVRRALHLALDRQAAMKVIMQGEAFVGGAVMPGPWSIPPEELAKMPGYRQPKDQDIAEAKKLLAEAGYPNGFKTKIMTRAGDKLYEDTAILTRDNMAKIGIEAEVQPVEQAASYQRLFSHDFDVFAGSGTVSIDDPDAFFGEMYLSSSPGNYGQYKSSRLDELFVQQAQALDPQKRKEIVLEMQRIIENDQPVPMLLWRGGTMLFWPEVRNYVASFTNPTFYPTRFENVWLAR